MAYALIGITDAGGQYAWVPLCHERRVSVMARHVVDQVVPGDRFTLNVSGDRLRPPGVAAGPPSGVRRGLPIHDVVITSGELGRGYRGRGLDVFNAIARDPGPRTCRASEPAPCPCEGAARWLRR